jgi:hypothetical protein
MLTLQIIFILFFLLAIVKAIFRYRQGQLSASRLFFWLIFWLLAGVVVALPNSTATLAKIVGIGRGADLIIYLALALLFFLNFQSTIKMEKINKEITKLTRAITLKDGDK